MCAKIVNKSSFVRILSGDHDHDRNSVTELFSTFHFQKPHDRIADYVMAQTVESTAHSGIVVLALTRLTRITSSDLILMADLSYAYAFQGGTMDCSTRRAARTRKPRCCVFLCKSGELPCSDDEQVNFIFDTNDSNDIEDTIIHRII